VNAATKRSDLEQKVEPSMKESRNRILTTAAFALGVVALAPSAAQAAPAGDGNVAIKAGKIITNAGEVIEGGTILIENGRITAVGTDVKVPMLIEVVDASGLVAFPGWVEAITDRGMDRSNENIDVAAFLDVRDSIDPVNFFFEDALRAGVTTLNVEQGSDCVVGGSGHVVKPIGMTVEEMSVKPRAGIVMSLSPRRGKSHATQAQALRRVFDDLRRYLQGVVDEKRQGKDYARREAMYQGREPAEGEDPNKGVPMAGSSWKVEGLELVPRWELDEKQAPILKIVEGRIPVFVYCGSPMEVSTAISIARENGFLEQTTFVLDASCWKAADELAAAGRPVILDSTLVHIENDPVTGDEIETFVPGVFLEKKVAFALRSQNSSTQSLWYQAARCVGQGIDRQVAIDAATKVPAQLLGLADRLGSLEAGKDGNVLLYSGDPLSVTSFVEHVFIEGRHAYDRSKDVRVEHLRSGKQPENTAAPENQPDLDAESADETGEEERSSEGDDSGEDD